MKCSNCGQIISSDAVYCSRCGEEVRIVPDYNPLDDILTEQVKQSINQRNDMEKKIPQDRRGRTAPMNQRPAEKRVIDEREARRRQAERRRELKRKRRRCVLIIMVIFLALCGGIVTLLYQTSYAGIMNKGDKAFSTAHYTEARTYYEKAISKKPDQIDAYIGIADIYVAKKDIVKAEKIYLDAISKYPEQVSFYEACIQFYLDSNQALEIPKMISGASDKIQQELSEYTVEQPVFSLQSGVVYDEVQQLSLSSDKAKTIYYTTNGTEPTMSSSEYTEPIQLAEGETTIKAIAVNEKGIPSLSADETYVIELPIEDAPAVSPSTGQYEEPTQIEIKVPEGYTAYYTIDGSTPTTASTKYSEPIDMPEGNTLFKAILVNAAGRASGVTTRNYILELPENYE